jgi:cell division protein FtsB
MTETGLKKMVQAVCIGAVTVFFIMVIVLVILFSKKSAVANNIKNLERDIQNAELQKATLEQEIEYRSSLEYIESYARRRLGMIKRGETKFVPK